MPYFEAAFAALPGTRLVALVPRRGAEARRGDDSVRFVEAPAELAAPFPYGMVWHPRLNSDPAHVWARALVSEVAAELRPGTP
ncbi:hypothetical protein [Kutzneria sp. CA-103260]|uniref:hypothetical protein n=1 Tax=Kutzneria sp. CA-103260 TaxID=2802641 RepID=UPI001BAA3CE7|nr:hypothetical protein [Kutzneria sp. CA-103260]QUQ66588.1 LysR family transcriptional regulator [Kutzneria sp. CA-103260]